MDDTITPLTLERLRSGNAREVESAMREIRRASQRWISYRSFGLSASEIEDIVSEAFVAVFEQLRSPLVPHDKALRELQKALNHQRALAKRLRSHEESLTIRRDWEPQTVPDASISENLVLKVVQIVKSLVPEALLSLSDRDRALIIEEYNLESYGFEAVGRESTLALGPGARRTALSRARMRFLNHLEELLIAFSEEVKYKDVVEIGLRVLRGGSLNRLFGVAAELEQQSEAEKTGAGSARSAETKVEEEVGDPSIIVVWNPEILSEGDYLEIVAALGDLVRAEGGLGIKLVESNELGIEVRVGVCV